MKKSRYKSIENRSAYLLQNTNLQDCVYLQIKQKQKKNNYDYYEKLKDMQRERNIRNCFSELIEKSCVKFILDCFGDL